jgi:hypothetical protein
VWVGDVCGEAGVCNGADGKVGLTERQNELPLSWEVSKSFLFVLLNL